LAINRQDYVQSTEYPPEGWLMPETQGAFFGDCPHPRAEVVMEKRGTHYARRVCSDCRKFLGWIPHPDNVRKARENAEILTALSKLDNLPSWERQFIRSLVTTKHISPKQQAKLYEVRDMFLKGVNQ
jgi:hypothetical protein